MVNELDERVALLTLQEARLYCLRSAGDSSRDELIIDAVNDVSEAIRDYCDREFVSSTGETTLDGDISSGATALDVADAGSFPSSGSFYVRLDDEVLLVTAGAGSTSWTVTRAQLGTTAAAHTNGAAVVELEPRVFRYNGHGSLDLSPYDLRELYSVTLYTDLDESLHDEVDAGDYQLTPVGGWPGSLTYIGLGLPTPPTVDEASPGFGWQATVLGRWGMSSIPGSVKLAAKIWVDNIVKNPGSYASNTMNGYTVFPDPDLDEDRRAGMPPASRYRLDKWRRSGGAGAGDRSGTVRFAHGA